MRLAWLLVAAVVTLEQAKSGRCETACGYLGYSWGYYTKDQCACVDFKPYEETTHKKRIIMPNKHVPGKSSSYGPPTTYSDKYISEW